MSMNKQELFQAFREAASSEFADIPRDDSHISCALSAEFENRMNSLMNQASEVGEKQANRLTELEPR